MDGLCRRLKDEVGPATVVATGKQYQAKWIGYDKGSDVAVIQLEGATGLNTVPLGDSSTVKVGDQVVGMGNAGGRITGRLDNLHQRSPGDRAAGMTAHSRPTMLARSSYRFPIIARSSVFSTLP